MFFVVVACLLIMVTADKSETSEYENTNDGSGNYRFRFMTPNGITHEETGNLVNVGKDNVFVAVEGSYSYTDPDGKEVIVNYIVDENGYHVLEPFPEVFYPESPSQHAVLLGK